MWSDRPSRSRRTRIARRLRAVLPAPAPGSRGSKTPLRSGARRDEPGPEALADLFREQPREQPGLAWLDGGPGASRLYPRPIATLAVHSGRATVEGPGGRETFKAGGFELLEAAFEAWGDTAGAVLAGYLGYELANEIEPLPSPPPDDLDLPDLHLALYDAGLLWDGRGWTLEATGAWGGPSLTAIEAERLLAAARRRTKPERPGGRLAGGPVVSRPNRGGYEAAVERIRERIAAGEIFQANLCRRLEAPLDPQSVWPFYLRLRDASPADHGAFLDLGQGRSLLSVSPELFLTVRGAQVETRPIKGTRPRGASPREDRALARELAESAKDRAELTMIVDVARNDLGRVCEPGSVEVPVHGELVSLPTVHHTVSTVRGRLLPGTGPADLLRASFPPASITGAPKIRAMSILANEEERRRGPAMGAFGWISLAGGGLEVAGGGDLELAVAIRTAVCADSRVVYHAGCGIVADSDPELEFEESAVKAKAFLIALAAALGAAEPT
ncbi:MAG TPA: anthranilate synthase component I family protein [Thermoanaerobaculia bacterium]|jgi:para-aminobenzoate synthetase component 1|nr:anthranilate synthase component I family protein [Thermoanaerobaculia bacterium]